MDHVIGYWPRAEDDERIRQALEEGRYGVASSSDEAHGMLDDYEAVAVNGALLTRVSRLGAVSGGALPGFTADQVGAFLSEHPEATGQP